ncbi:MAG: TAT-variant-translocated molybdopterin oxidoreductase, partial [Acidobacteria bacterium]|nr:TAT-variant-translocated molybdopterin oxidoreductase [Acidobacteriota bacterium]
MPSPESKHNFALLRDRILSQNGKEYWRSIEEYVDAPEFAEFVSREYPHEIEEWDNSLSRRNFVKVMGASLALAGLTGCVIQPSEKIVPYVKNPDGMLPGKANYYATSMTLGGVATGLLAKSFEGRPIKVEGNPDHPGSRGATDVLAQASILGMYDPDRSQEFRYRGNPKTWETFVSEFRSAIDENRPDGGAGVRFLTETVTSPTLIDQFNKLKTELPNAKLVQYEPINSDNAMAGAKMAFGSPVQTIYKFDKATRVLSLDADIFSSFNVGYIKDFSSARRYSEEKKEINRLYSVETTISITGAKADHRLAVKPSQMPEIAKAIAAAVGVGGASSSYKENSAWIAAMAKDLVANKGRAVVVVGDNQPAIVHAIGHAINGVLGAVGQTVAYADPFAPNSDRTQLDQYKELVADIDAGKIKMLVIVGGNPAYNTPADLRLDLNRLNKVATRVHLGLYFDETAELCHWHLPQKHYLESWSDSRAYDGTANIVQPLIQPLYDGKNVHELVQLFFKENFDKKDYDIVREYWQRTNITVAAPAKAEQAAQTATAGTAAPNTAANAAAKVTTPPAAAAKTAPSANTAPKSTGTQPATSANTAARPANTPAAPAAPANTAGAAAFEDHWRKAVHDGVIPNTAATP